MLTHDYVQERRTIGTVMSLELFLRDANVDELISDIFISAETTEAKELIKRFEYILIKGAMNFDFLYKNLHKFFKETANIIKEKNLYKEFAEFSYLVYKSLSIKGSDIRSLSAYQNLLLQQFTYLTPPHKVLYGITVTGELMLTNELYPKLDYPVHEIEDKKITSREAIEKIFKSYGFDKEYIINIDRFSMEERVLVNMMTEMVPFIDEETSDIFPERLYRATKGLIPLRKWKSTDYYKEALRKRKYILPPDGVLALYRNAEDIKSVFFKEVFRDDGVFLLYRINNRRDEGLYGVYDLKDEFFYSVYRDSSAVELHYFIENFILETYCHLTTDIIIDRKRNQALKVVDNINENHYPRPDEIFVEFLYKEKIKGEEKTEKQFRKYSKEKYKKETIDVNPYIRKLPAGAVASEEAINRAKAFGYELEEGETFIRAFKRSAYKLKE